MAFEFRSKHLQRSFRTFFTVMLLASLLSCQVNSTVNWVSYPDITSGQIVIYPGPFLVNSNSPPVSFTQPISLSSAAIPINLAFGINFFQVPNDQDFSIIINKTYTTTSFTIKVYLEDDTVCQILKMNYIAMISTSLTFRLLSDYINPTVISDSFGYRSETDFIYVNITADPFFTSTSLSSVLVLQGFRIDPQGSFSFIDSIVTIGQNGTINATFYTFEEISVTYIAYSILFYDANEASTTTQLIFQVGSVEFTNDSSIASNFFSNILSRYTAAAGRMFFGISSFNYTLSSIKTFGFDSSVFGNLYSTYTFTNSIYSVKLSYFFFVQRNCNPTLYFYYNYVSPSLDDCVATCSLYNDRPTNDNTYYQCLPCDATCLTCSGSTPNTCQSCDPNSNRVMAGAGPSSCNCVANYVSVVSTSACVPCSSQMVGCQTCSNATTCITCLPGFTGPPCSCVTASIVAGYCNTVYGCTNISTINGSQICINCNAKMFMQLTSAFTCACIQGTITMADKSCQPKCGDNYVLKVESCDDGNSVEGDGCSTSCTVDQDWLCIGRYAQGSTCKINTTIQLTYMGAERVTKSNTAIFYFSLSPTFDKYSDINFNDIFVTTINYSNLSVVYSSSQNLLVATISYNQDIQNTLQQFQVLLNKSPYFWNPTNQVNSTLTGINCQLTFDTAFELRQGFYYTLLILLFTSILVFIISCLFFQKWIGLQLILTYQTYYFLFALVKQFPFQLSPFPEVMMYSQGYDGILNSEYYRTYGLPNYLLALGVEKEFISNFNTMYLIIVALAIVLIILGLNKRRYKSMLQQVVSSEINKKVKKSQKWFSFVFSRIFMMTVFYSMFKIIFSFAIQLGNDQSAQEYFPDELNVTAGILAFIIVFSMISYVLYWYLLLPDNFTEEQEFMSLRFQNMQFNYPIIFLAYQALFILTLSILIAQSLVGYILLALQVAYLVFLIYLRPYNSIHRLNRLIHNFNIIFNQLSCIFCLGIIMRWNSIIGTDYQPSSNHQLTIYSVLMLLLLTISLGLSIVRLATFNKEISFKCCKKKQEQEDFEQIDYNSMKRMETDRKEQFFKGQAKNVELAILSKIKGEPIFQQQPQKKKNKKSKQNDPSFHLNEAQIDAYLNQNTIHWNKQTLVPNNVPKVSYKNIKKSTSSKTAQRKKSPLEEFLQLKKKRQQDKL